MNYIDNNNFLNNELIPLVKNVVSDYVNEEISYIETLDDLDEFEYSNCPEELRANIIEDINNLILDCIDDYDIITNIDDDDYEEKINNIIDNVYEEIKSTSIDIRREDFDRLDYFEDEEEMFY